MKEVSVTGEFKEKLTAENAKIVRKITKVYDKDLEQEIFNIYFKPGVISSYSGEECEMTMSYVRDGIDGINGMINEIVLR